MALIYFYTDKGILLIEGNIQTLNALKEVGAKMYTEAVNAFSELDQAEVKGARLDIFAAVVALPAIPNAPSSNKQSEAGHYIFR